MREVRLWRDSTGHAPAHHLFLMSSIACWVVAREGWNFWPLLNGFQFGRNSSRPGEKTASEMKANKKAPTPPQQSKMNFWAAAIVFFGLSLTVAWIIILAYGLAKIIEAVI